MDVDVDVDEVVLVSRILVVLTCHIKSRVDASLDTYTLIFIRRDCFVSHIEASPSLGQVHLKY